jgi:hypothetical protein
MMILRDYVFIKVFDDTEDVTRRLATVTVAADCQTVLLFENTENDNRSVTGIQVISSPVCLLERLLAGPLPGLFSHLKNSRLPARPAH